MTNIFEINRCRLSNGSYEDALDDVFEIDAILTSPPYNIGSKSPQITGRRKFGLYDQKSYRGITGYPDMTDEDEYQESQKQFIRWALRHLKTNGVLLYNHKPRHKDGRRIDPREWILQVPEAAIHDEVVWDRGSTHNHCKGHLYAQSESIYVITKVGARPYYNNKRIPNDIVGGRGIGYGNVWRIPPQRSKFHNAPFPLLLAERCVNIWTPPGGLVVDTYSGSGTTMMACLKHNRRFVGAEKQQDYFEKSMERVKKYQLTLDPFFAEESIFLNN